MDVCWGYESPEDQEQGLTEGTPVEPQSAGLAQAHHPGLSENPDFRLGLSINNSDLSPHLD